MEQLDLDLGEPLCSVKPFDLVSIIEELRRRFGVTEIEIVEPSDDLE